MQQIYPDLWQTRAEQPLPSVADLVTRAYLITRADGNLLIYSTGLPEEHQAIGDLGGIRRQYLSHVDEAGPALKTLQETFGSELWGHAVEADAVLRRAGVAPNRTFTGPEKPGRCTASKSRVASVASAACSAPMDARAAPGRRRSNWLRSSRETDVASPKSWS